MRNYLRKTSNADRAKVAEQKTAEDKREVAKRKTLGEYYDVSDDYAAGNYTAELSSLRSKRKLADQLQSLSFVSIVIGLVFAAILAYFRTEAAVLMTVGDFAWPITLVVLGVFGMLYFGKVFKLHGNHIITVAKTLGEKEDAIHKRIAPRVNRPQNTPPPPESDPR